MLVPADKWFALKLWLKAYFLINGREGQPDYRAIRAEMHRLEKEEKNEKII
jgi:hypothetical protein